MSLEFDYHGTMQQAKKLKNSADELKRLVRNRYYPLLEDIGTAWEGDAAVIFMSGCRNRAEELMRQAGQLDDLADRLIQIAHQIREAEQQAQSGMGGGGTSGHRF